MGVLLRDAANVYRNDVRFSIGPAAIPSRRSEAGERTEVIETRRPALSLSSTTTAIAVEGDGK
jgi:hypothetical protein